MITDKVQQPLMHILVLLLFIVFFKHFFIFQLEILTKQRGTVHKFIGFSFLNNWKSLFVHEFSESEN